MKFIGNYKDWLQPEWIEYVLNNDGKEMPRWEFKENGILEAISRGERAEFCEFQKRYEEVGYRHDSLLYYVFEQDNFPFDLALPPFVDLQPNQGAYWNLFKYKPGHLLPIHSDRIPKFEKNCVRYWMSWLDWQDGHILLYENKMIADYAAGDAFIFPDPFAVHGAANIGLTPRISFQITVFDEA